MFSPFPVTHQQLLASGSFQHVEGSACKQPITLQRKINCGTLIKQNPLGMSFTGSLILLLTGDLARKLFLNFSICSFHQSIHTTRDSGEEQPLEPGGLGAVSAPSRRRLGQLAYLSALLSPPL